MTLREWAAYAEAKGFAELEVVRLALKCNDEIVPIPGGYHFEDDSPPTLKEIDSKRIKLKDKVRIAGTGVYGTVVAMRHDTGLTSSEYMVTIEHVAEIDGKKYLVREDLIESDLVNLAVIGG